MCRMGFVSSDHNIELTSYVRKATNWYGRTQRDGMGYAYVVYDTLRHFKTPMPAPEYWKTHPNVQRIWTKSLIWHTRIASNGAVIFRNTHPFVNGTVALAHNGVLHNYESAQKDMISHGYIFQSDTDSEVILAAYMTHGIKFLDYLKSMGVTGTLTVMILTLKNILLYTNNSAMILYEVRRNNENIVYGTSDVSFLGRENAKSPQNNVIYSISNAHVTPIKQVEIPRYNFTIQRNSDSDTWLWKYVAQNRIRD